MPVLPVTELGQGPDLVLLHGVGAGPPTFAVLAQLLAADHRVLLVERPGSPGRAVPIDEQVAAVADTMAALGAVPATVVGVSGGATLGLALGIRHPEVVEALVLHEPLVGGNAPDLHRRFTAIAAAASVDDAAALDAVRGVLGEASWERLDETMRSQVTAAAAWARLEIPLFAAFDPTPDDLRRLRALPVLVSVGAESGSERHGAARVLADLAGAAVAIIPGAANAVQLDAAPDFAAAIRTWRPAPIGSGG